jgi:predicted TIM-barrel fold metal-dependent hydrolase
MDRVGVGIMAISALPALSGDIQRGNDEVADVVGRHPDRFIGYAHVNANFPELLRSELERCFAKPGFKGIKVYPLGVPYDDPGFEPVWEFAAERRAPVLAHTWAGDLTGLDRCAQRHPAVPFLAAHAGSELQYQAYIDAAKRARNLHLDLTYSRNYANLIEHFVRMVGTDQIVWGTDQPLFSMAQQAAKVLFARIPDEDKKKILYTTAARLFGLEK